MTWGNGTTGIVGLVTASDSLVGGTPGDLVGINGVTALTNGNRLVVGRGASNIVSILFGESVAVPTASTTGRVTTASGQGIRNAVVILTDATGVRRSATTSSFGIYQFDEVLAGDGYTLNVVSKRFRFAPRVFCLLTNLTNIDFVGLE